LFKVFDQNEGNKQVTFKIESEIKGPKNIMTKKEYKESFYFK